MRLFVQLQDLLFFIVMKTMIIIVVSIFIPILLIIHTVRAPTAEREQWGEARLFQPGGSRARNPKPLKNPEP